MLAQGASVVGGCAADCCAVVAPLPLRKPRRNAKLTGALRLWRVKTRFRKFKPNVAKTSRIRERSTQGRQTIRVTRRFKVQSARDSD
jgi:hypothetical protein